MQSELSPNCYHIGPQLLGKRVCNNAFHCEQLSTGYGQCSTQHEKQLCVEPEFPYHPRQLCHHVAVTQLVIL
jgi:hypothetical protein